MRMSVIPRSWIRGRSVCSSGRGPSHGDERLLREFLGYGARIHRAAIKRHSNDSGCNTAVCQGAQMVEASEPARGKDRKFGRLGYIFHQGQVCSPHRFLPMDGSYQHPRERQPVELFNEVQHELGMCARPAVRQDLPIADICCHDDAAREQAAHLGEPIRVLQRMRAYDYTLCSIVERVLNQLPASYSSAQLYLNVGRSENRLNFRGIVPAPGHRIKVDDVEMPEAVLPPGKSNPNRVRDSDKLLVVGSRRELNAGTASQIERRNCDHPARVGVRAQVMTAEGAALIAC